MDAFWGSYALAGRPGARYALRHPLALWRAVRAAHRLPLVPVAPSSTPGGRAVGAAARTRTVLGIPSRVLGTSALAIPAETGAYLAGRSAATLRRKVRAAQRAGVVVEAVRDRAEREHLVALADERERHHPDPTYRVAEPDNQDLLDHDLCLVARGPDGSPLLLSVTPVDRDLATLRYFRTLGSGPLHSDARYLLTAELVDRLSARGVRWLLDTEPVSTQTSGLRHFQRMLGFQYVRVRLARTPATGGATAGWHAVHAVAGYAAVL